jgi:hypothetical protein
LWSSQPLLAFNCGRDKDEEAGSVCHHYHIWKSRGMTWVVGSRKVEKNQKPVYVPFTEKYPLDSDLRKFFWIL